MKLKVNHGLSDWPIRKKHWFYSDLLSVTVTTGSADGAGASVGTGVGAAGATGVGAAGVTDIGEILLTASTGTYIGIEAVLNRGILRPNLCSIPAKVAAATLKPPT